MNDARKVKWNEFFLRNDDDDNDDDVDDVKDNVLCLLTTTIASTIRVMAR